MSKKTEQKRWESKPTLINHKTRLLCLTCQSVEPVIDFRPLARLCVLKCGCTRKVVA